MLKNKIKSLFSMRDIKISAVADKLNFRYETASRKISTGRFTLQEFTEIMELAQAEIVVQDNNGEQLFKITKNDFK